jgi:hypothetical protein
MTTYLCSRASARDDNEITLSREQLGRIFETTGTVDPADLMTAVLDQFPGLDQAVADDVVSTFISDGNVEMIYRGQLWLVEVGLDAADTVLFVLAD